MVETIASVGIYLGESNQTSGFLSRWCEKQMDFAQPSASIRMPSSAQWMSMPPTSEAPRPKHSEVTRGLLLHPGRSFCPPFARKWVNRQSARRSPAGFHPAGVFLPPVGEKIGDPKKESFTAGSIICPQAAKGAPGFHLALKAPAALAAVVPRADLGDSRVLKWLTQNQVKK